MDEKNLITILMIQKLKYNVVEQQVGKWGLITLNTLVIQCYNCLRTIKRGTGGNKSLPAPEEEFGEGTSRMQIFTAGVDFTYPFTIGNQPFRFNTSWNGQWNGTPLTQQDKFSIGGRYTVRGFDGELSLSGEKRLVMAK